MRAPWLADVLRGAGLEVVEVGGWRGRGRELGAIHGVVVHDTVTTTSWSDRSVADLLRRGRPDVPGPLSQLGLDRDGRFWLIADGRANHNGYGTWGNDAIGIEVFAAGGLTGREERWNPAQEEAAARGTAAILAHVGHGASQALGHKETDPRRKIDPWNVDMGAFRARVAAHLTGGADIVTDEQMATLGRWMQEQRELTERRIAEGFREVREKQAEDRKVIVEDINDIKRHLGI